MFVISSEAIMPSRGVHFALTEPEVQLLLEQTTEDDLLNLVVEQFEERYFTESPEWLAESDKAWDAMHRILTDGELSLDNGTYPLNHVILGGEFLYGSDDYIMSLKKPQQVTDIAEALAKFSESEFRARYFEIDEEDYEAEVSEDDYEYTRSWFLNVLDLYQRAAGTGRSVLFTADQ